MVASAPKARGGLGLQESPAGERQEQLRLNTTKILSFSSESPQPLSGCRDSKETAASTCSRLPLLLTPCHHQLPADELPRARTQHPRGGPGQSLTSDLSKPAHHDPPSRLPACAPRDGAARSIRRPAGHCSPADRSSSAVEGGVRKKASACLSLIQPLRPVPRGCASRPAQCG